MYYIEKRPRELRVEHSFKHKTELEVTARSSRGHFLFSMNIRKYVPLAPFSSFRIGGPARFFCAPKNIREIQEALMFAKQNKEDIFVLGGGTNLLIGDEGFGGLVVQPRLTSLVVKGKTVHAGAGVRVSDLLLFTAKNKLSGLEWAGGLPGTVGAAVRGNVGAFGGEIKDVCYSSESLNRVQTGVFFIYLLPAKVIRFLVRKNLTRYICFRMNTTVTYLLMRLLYFDPESAMYRVAILLRYFSYMKKGIFIRFNRKRIFKQI